MADQLKKPRRVRGPQQEEAWIVFTTAGTGAPTTVDGRGGCTVARTGVGVFVVTLDYGAYTFIPDVSFKFTTTAQQPLITAYSETSKTVTVTVVGAGGNTAADTTGMTIFVTIKMRMEN